MKLLYRIMLRLSVALLVLLTVWAVFFYIKVVDEINDNVDDALENYSEQIITRTLAAQPLPPANSEPGRSYHIESVTEEYARSRPHVAYSDDRFFIPSSDDDEPARIRRTIYKDSRGDYFELTVGVPSIEKDDLREAILFQLVVLYLLLLATILLINAWVIYRNMRPLYMLLRWLDKFHLGVDHTPLDNPTSVTEFRRLNEAVERSVERAERAFGQQKQFTGNASHEMQTPLAVLSNRIEWLIDHTELAPEQLAELGKAQQTIGQLVRLNKSLLLLSRIESGQFPEFGDVDMNHLLREQTESFAEVYAPREIAVTLTEQGQLTVRMNESLAGTLTSNLLKNACLHSAPHSHIEVTVLPDGITVCNPASGAPLDAERIFDRFYQGDGRAGTAGLGLSIAEAVCRLYGIRIAYSFDDGRHCFSLQWAK